MIRRYIVHDEDGPLRSFYTRAEAIAFMTDDMTLQVLPKPKKDKINFEEEEEAKW